VSQSPDSLRRRTSAGLRYPSPASRATDQLTEFKEPANDDQDGSPEESGARAFGHSKDLRTDLPQVVIALAGTRDGVPVRCRTFPGNTADTAIIRTVKDDQTGWNLRRLVWVADPYGQHGFASATNRAYLTDGDGHYIHAEKLRHTNTEAAAALARAGRYRTVAENLRVKEVHAPGGHGNGDEGARAVRFVVCHNPEQAERDTAVRTNLIAYLEQLIDGSDDWTARRSDVPVGSLRNKPGLRRYVRRTKAGLLRVDHAPANRESHLDGKWLLATSDPTPVRRGPRRGLQAAAGRRTGLGEMKCALELRPVFHYREHHIRAHVQLCWLALLMIRVIENTTGGTWCNLHHELDRLHLVTLATPRARWRNAPRSAPEDPHRTPTARTGPVLRLHPTPET
jgi:hypothetical protein